MSHRNPSIAAVTLFYIVCALFATVAGFAYSTWDAPEEYYEYSR